MTKLHDPIDDQELDRRLRTTFHTVMPLLDVPQPRGFDEIASPTPIEFDLSVVADRHRRHPAEPTPHPTSDSCRRGSCRRCRTRCDRRPNRRATRLPSRTISHRRTIVRPGIRLARRDVIDDSVACSRCTDLWS